MAPGSGTRLARSLSTLHYPPRRSPRPSSRCLPLPRFDVPRIFKNLTFRVLVAVALGVVVGIVWPDFGKALKPLGDTFINLVRMVIAPIIFLTIVAGIATIGDLKQVGRVGGKAFLYFEVVTTFALGIGLIVVNITKPGAGLDATTMAKGDISRYTTASEQMSFVDFVVHIVPSSVVEAFAKGEILQVVFFAVLFGVALTMSGEIGRNITDGCERLAQVFFKLVALIMHVAPLGAFGAMAFTVGSFGLRTLLPLGRLMLDVYLTMALFIFVVLNIICRLTGFSLWEYLKYIREEILLVLGTSSSEAALPLMLEKLERYGCDKSVVRLVIPDGVLVQPRRDVDLPVDGAHLHRPGLPRRPVDRAAADGALCAHAHIQGGGRGDRERLHRPRLDAGGDAGRPARGAGVAAGGRPVHERGAGDHEPHRQRGGDARHLAERGELR